MEFTEYVQTLKKTVLSKNDCFNYAPEVLFGVSVAKTSKGRQFLTRLPFGQKASLRKFG